MKKKEPKFVKDLEKDGYKFTKYTCGQCGDKCKILFFIKALKIWVCNKCYLKK